MKVPESIQLHFCVLLQVWDRRFLVLLEVYFFDVVPLPALNIFKCEEFFNVKMENQLYFTYMNICSYNIKIRYFGSKFLFIATLLTK